MSPRNIPALALSSLLLSGAASAQLIGGGWESENEILGTVGLSSFGWSIAINGDMNGDGIPEILAGAPSKGAGAGGYYVIDGATNTVQTIVNGENTADRLGLELVTLGDVNGDGISEFVISAPGFDPGGKSYAGRIYIVNGAKLNEYITVDGENAGDNFGDGLEVIPDINNDGIKDIAVSSDMGDDGVNTDCGILYLLSGADGSELMRFYGPEPESRFGCEITHIGDINGDGVEELLVGAKGSEVDLGNGPETDVGRAFVMDGVTGFPIHIVSGQSAFGYFGSAVSRAGDVDKDGIPDFIVAAQEHTEASVGSECGAIFIYSGATGHLLRKHVGENPEDKFGKSVWGNVDVNNDGRLDVIVGAHLKDKGANDFPGGIYVFSNNGDMILNYTGNGFRERLGSEIEVVGDTDGNGYPEFLVCGPDYRPPTSHPRVGRLLEFEFDPYIYADTNEISAANGGTVNLTLDFRERYADQFYRTLFSFANKPHTYIGDLLITLYSPSGYSVILHNYTGWDTEDIYGYYASSTGTLLPHDSLSTLVGVSGDGTWTLTVEDSVGGDSGQLNSWSLDLICL